MSAGPKNRKREGESAFEQGGGHKSKVFAFARSFACAVDLGRRLRVSVAFVVVRALATSFWRGISGIATLSELLFKKYLILITQRTRSEHDQDHMLG